MVYGVALATMFLCSWGSTAPASAASAFAVTLSLAPTEIAMGGTSIVTARVSRGGSGYDPDLCATSPCPREVYFQSALGGLAAADLTAAICSSGRLDQEGCETAAMIGSAATVLGRHVSPAAGTGTVCGTLELVLVQGCAPLAVSDELPPAVPVSATGAAELGALLSLLCARRRYRAAAASIDGARAAVLLSWQPARKRTRTDTEARRTWQPGYRQKAPIA
ncbi:MAG: hypothetical protein HYV63_33210 [Candidatus Schekmanbacteria bacterium]|nr:hypothetical protein [Candidatus Schekmanbacteria bacterium]